MDIKNDQFRFEEMGIWIKAVELSEPVIELADQLEIEKKFRYVEQLRSAMLSVSNNMVEGSGSMSDKDFANFYNIARRSIFEVASMLLVFHKHRYILDRPTEILADLMQLSKITYEFSKTLRAD